MCDFYYGWQQIQEEFIPNVDEIHGEIGIIPCIIRDIVKKINEAMDDIKIHKKLNENTNKMDLIIEQKKRNIACGKQIENLYNIVMSNEDKMQCLEKRRKQENVICKEKEINENIELMKNHKQKISFGQKHRAILFEWFSMVFD